MTQGRGKVVILEAILGLFLLFSGVACGNIAFVSREKTTPDPYLENEKNQVTTEFVVEMSICALRNSRLSVCVLNNVLKIKKMLKDGIPQLEIPPFEPLLKDEMRDSSLNAVFYNVTIWGVSNFSILKFDVVNPTLTTMKTFTPLLVFHSNCVIGITKERKEVTNGTCIAKISRVITTMNMKITSYIANGVKYLVCKEIDIRMQYGDSSMRIYHMKKHKQKHRDDVSVNENIKGMTPSIVNIIQEVAGDYFKLFINGVYGKRPSDELFDQN